MTVYVISILVYSVLLGFALAIMMDLYDVNNQNKIKESLKKFSLCFLVASSLLSIDCLTDLLNIHGKFDYGYYVLVLVTVIVYNLINTRKKEGDKQE